MNRLRLRDLMAGELRQAKCVGEVMHRHRRTPNDPDNGRRRRWTAAGAVLTLVAIAALVGAVTSGAAARRRYPELIIGDSVADDFRTLASETWDRFLQAFEARSDCFGDVRLRAAYSLDSRGGYDPDSATVTVRVPGTRAMLQSALVHEWAHHIEFQCEAHRQLRPAFLIAQGLPPDTPWRPDDAPTDLPASAWAGIPSEQWAEATIELVLGRRPIPTTVRVARESIRVVKKWAGGD